MRKATIAGLVVFFVVPCGVAQAELVCPMPRHEAGTVYAGKSLAYPFCLKNKGDQTVEILSIKPGCGCIQARANKLKLHPGETCSVNLEVNTIAQPAGPNAWQAVVSYREAGQTREIQLIVAASVIQQISIEPANLVIYTDGPFRYSFTLTDRRAKHLTVRALVTSSNNVQMEKKEPTRSKEGNWVFPLSLLVKSSCPEGRHMEVLHIHTDDPEYSKLTVPFTVVMHPKKAVTAVPPEVGWNLSEMENLPSRIVLFTAADGKECVIDHVEPDCSAVRCTFARGPGIRSTLKIQLDPKLISGSALPMRVKVHFSQPANQTVTIPLRIY
jgi:hypothetical protein